MWARRMEASVFCAKYIEVLGFCRLKMSALCLFLDASTRSSSRTIARILHQLSLLDEQWASFDAIIHPTNQIEEEGAITSNL